MLICTGFSTGLESLGAAVVEQLQRADESRPSFTVPLLHSNRVLKAQQAPPAGGRSWEGKLERALGAPSGHPLEAHLLG